MARKLDVFPTEDAPQPRRYPWNEWTDGSAWEIRQGDDYDIDTENMRVNLHVKADAIGAKVRTKKITDAHGEGLVFEFNDPEAKEVSRLLATATPTEITTAMDMLYADALEIYERARKEVTIPRKDGRRQHYAAVRYKRQIEEGYAANALVPAIARVVRKSTLGFGHLEAAERSDLMVERLVLDETKPYHRFFTRTTIEAAEQRMRDRGHLN